MKPAAIMGITILGFAFLALGAGAHSASPAGTARAGGYRIVLASTRDGATRAYSARPDGSHLTPLLRPTHALEPLDVSGNGRTVLYTDHRYPNTISVSHADGTGLRRVARGNKKSGIDSATLSPDGKMLAFTSSQRISVVGADGRGRRSLGVGSEPDWSPDGKALVFANEAKHCSVVVQSLQGGRRVLARGACSASPKWSPDGRWIAYESGSETTSLWVVGLNG
jgi:TolB protein